MNQRRRFGLDNASAVTDTPLNTPTADKNTRAHGCHVILSWFYRFAPQPTFTNSRNCCCWERVGNKAWWLILASVITAVSIWTCTHFVTMETMTAAQSTTLQEGWKINSIPTNNLQYTRNISAHSPVRNWFHSTPSTAWKSPMTSTSLSHVNVSTITFRNATFLLPLTSYDNDNNTSLMCPSSRNAIVYLAQKQQHSSYAHAHSFKNLARSLQLLYHNYLSLNSNCHNVDIFLFHTGDFNATDYPVLQSYMPCASLRLVDLSTSLDYWSLPPSVIKDDTSKWYMYSRFSTGYRLMIQWYAITIWKFFDDLHQEHHCHYQYIWRMDDDSYIHSPIAYNVFDFMQKHQSVYGFRMCSYEMAKAQRMWKVWTERQVSLPSPLAWKPHRSLHHDMCGFYNNFFIAHLDFFRQPNLQALLRMIERKGHIFRKLLGDLTIHSMAVYMYANASEIHRFLDFTYEHASYNYSFDKTIGNGTTSRKCLLWGGIQAGTDDPDAATIVEHFCRNQPRSSPDCPQSPSVTVLGADDLSPSYAHLSQEASATLRLATCVAGAVEIPGKGILSG
jgi:hypothetical protein